MPSFSKNSHDFWTGIMFIAFGTGGILFGRDYAMQQDGGLGPGFLPSILAALLVLIGLAAFIRSFVVEGPPMGKFALKPVSIVLASILVFGFLMRSAGFAIALVVLVVMGALASTRFRWVPTLMLAAGCTAFCVAVFVYALGLPLPVFGSWFDF